MWIVSFQEIHGDEGFQVAAHAVEEAQKYRVGTVGRFQVMKDIARIMVNPDHLDGMVKKCSSRVYDFTLRGFTMGEELFLCTNTTGKKMLEDGEAIKSAVLKPRNGSYYKVVYRSGLWDALVGLAHAMGGEE